MKKNLACASLVVALMVVLCPGAHAAGPRELPGGPGPVMSGDGPYPPVPPPLAPPGMGWPGMAGRVYPAWRQMLLLDLSDQQRAAIKEIESRTMKDSVRKFAEIQVARIELKELLDKETVDMKAVEAKLKTIASMTVDLRLSQIKALEEAKSKLTPEQRKKFKTMLEAHHGMGGPAHPGTGMQPPLPLPLPKPGMQPALPKPE